jgi:hypothetical protein
MKLASFFFRLMDNLMSAGLPYHMGASQPNAFCAVWSRDYLLPCLANSARLHLLPSFATLRPEGGRPYFEFGDVVIQKRSMLGFPRLIPPRSSGHRK